MNHTTISLKSIHNPSLFCCIFHVVQFSYMYAQQHLTKHAWIHDDTIPVECHLGLENIPAGTEEEYSLEKSLLYDKANPKTQYSCLWIPFNPLCASTPAQTTFRILAGQNAEPFKTFKSFNQITKTPDSDPGKLSLWHNQSRFNQENW